MRKITTATTAILLAAMMTAGISAYDAETAEKQADALNEMGLFKGTDNGYDLENVPTRAQSSVMLVRFLGKENEAMGLEYTAPFNDVADWAKPYIQYLWQNGLANGYGDGRYGADDPCTAQMYATIVLRVLGYSDKDAKDFTYDKAIEFATEKGLDCPAEGFLRGDMVGMTYSALSLETADKVYAKLAYKLSHDGVITDKQEKIVTAEEGHTYEFYPDGTLKKDTYAGGYHICDENGRVIEYASYYDDGTLSVWGTYYRSKGYLIEEYKSYDENGKLTRWSYAEMFTEFDYSYIDKQTPHIYIVYNEDGSIYQKDTYNNKGQLLEMLRGYEDGSFRAHFTCDYDGEKETKTTYYNEDGTLSHYITYDYNGNITTRSVYSANDELKSYNKDYYDDNGRWVRCEIYEADGFMSRAIDYAYDEDGNRTQNITDYERN